VGSLAGSRFVTGARGWCRRGQPGNSPGRTRGSEVSALEKEDQQLPRTMPAPPLAH
jgi:hypothetical protein